MLARSHFLYLLVACLLLVFFNSVKGGNAHIHNILKVVVCILPGKQNQQVFKFSHIICHSWGGSWRGAIACFVTNVRMKKVAPVVVVTILLALQQIQQVFKFSHIFHHSYGGGWRGATACFVTNVKMKKVAPVV